MSALTLCAVGVVLHLIARLCLQEFQYTLVEGARSVTELEAILDVHQPTLPSSWVSCVKQAKIVSKRSARAVVYRLADPRAGQLIGHLRLLFADPDASAIWRGTPIETAFSHQM